MMHGHDHEQHRHWRKFEAMARRGFGRFGPPGGFGGPGGGWGNWGNFGESFRVGRMLASGDLRLLALYLIEQQPRHGYDLIKAIEEKTAGLYSPSPGMVYPALTYLEEAGFVTSSSEGNKKLYAITDEGRAHLSENRQAVESTLDFLRKAGERMNEWRERAQNEAGRWGHHHGTDHPSERGGPNERPRADRDVPGVLEEVNTARRELKAAISDALDNSDENTQRRVADILRKAAELIRRRDVDLG